MKSLMKNSGLALLLIALVIVVIPAYAQEPVPPIPPEAQGEKARLLAEYRKTLEHELQYGQTTIDPEDGKTKMLVGESATKMDLLWQETVSQIQDLIARPASEREPIVKMIEVIDVSKPVYLERLSSPYNPSAALERYQTDKYLYAVDIASSQIIDISPVVDTSVPPSHNPEDNKLKGFYSQAELEKNARAFISAIATDIDLSALQPSFSDKEGKIYFFRWEDSSRILDDGTTPFVQVAFSSIKGNFVRFANTLPLAKTQSQAALQKLGMIPTIAKATFNDVYANGSTQGHWAWVQNGGYATTKYSDGYCYFAGWCSPTNFYWSYTDATSGYPRVIGKWIPNNSTQSTRMWAWIPSNNATAWSFYKAWVNDGGATVQNYIDQEQYSNEWKLVLGYYHDYTKIQLYNNADIANYKVAWDETWLCTSDIC